jgi:hypothetical protein
MRVIAELPHPECKITLFNMNSKYIIKFEQGTLEQTYKIAEMDILGGVNGVFEMLDEAFIQSIINRFASMRSDFLLAYKKYQ